MPTDNANTTNTTLTPQKHHTNTSIIYNKSITVDRIRENILKNKNNSNSKNNSTELSNLGIIPDFGISARPIVKQGGVSGVLVDVSVCDRTYDKNIEQLNLNDIDALDAEKPDTKIKMSGVHCEKCNTINPTSEIFNGICKTCIDVRKAEEHDKFKTPKKDFKYVLVRAITDIGLFMGVDENYYSMNNQDMASIPAINAKALIKRNAVRLIGGMS